MSTAGLHVLRPEDAAHPRALWPAQHSAGDVSEERRLRQ